MMHNLAVVTSGALFEDPSLIFVNHLSQEGEGGSSCQQSPTFLPHPVREEVAAEMNKFSFH